MPLVAIGMAGIGLIVIEVGERLADLDIALRGSRWTAIIRVGGNRLVASAQTSLVIQS